MDGFGFDAEGTVSMVANKYLGNLLAVPLFLILLLAGVVLVVLGVYYAKFKNGFRGIWPYGLGTVLVGLTVFCLPAFNNTAFYPSKLDLQSSLTIYNASSSHFTLTTMSYVAIGIPFVLAYIVYVWRQMDTSKLTSDEVTKGKAY
jgi:cytochrome d ubiquinol oxidase subunit II